MPSRAELVNRANALGITATNYPNDSKLEQKVIWAETHSATMAGTLATGTLTTTGDLADGDQVLIGTAAQGGITYTFVTALSEVKATGTYTNASIAVAGETITIDGITYTYFAAIDNTIDQPYAVLVGANPTASLANLILAIDKGATEGTNYGMGTVAHPRVSGVSSDATTAVVTYDAFGTIGNSALTSENAAGSWGATALAGGVDPVPNEVLLGIAAANSLDNLEKAIDDSGTEGTHYSTGTAAHPLVTAEANANDSQAVQAREYYDGEDISTTDPVDSGTHMAWGATTLASGVADQNAVDATAKAQTSGGANV
jgi:hypothetical protein